MRRRLLNMFCEIWWCEIKMWMADAEPKLWTLLCRRNRLCATTDLVSACLSKERRHQCGAHQPGCVQICLSLSARYQTRIVVVEDKSCSR